MANRAFAKYNAASMAQKLVIKAVLERGLITEGDRILLAVSGGKDSSVMAMTLANIRKALKIEYQLHAVHISTDFCSCCKKSVLSARLAEWGIPFTDLYVPVIERLKEGRKMNCFWCSMQRRGELLRYALENGYNTIALGHHLDDIIETLFMNMTGKGVLATMPALLHYRQYPVKLIRPLAYVEESQVIRCAADNGILKAACTCPYGRLSQRRVIRQKIAAFTGGSSAIKRRILKSLTTQKFDFLVE